jgi:hypothetical protein
MINIAGERGTTAESLKAFRDTMAKVATTLDFVILVSYAWSDQGDPNAHGFILPQCSSKRITVITDGFSSGYSGEGPRGLIECLRLVPYGLLIFNLVVPERQARQLFNGELTQLDILELYRNMRALRVYWSQDDAQHIIQLDRNMITIRQEKGTQEASLAPILKPKGPNLEPDLSRPY